MPSHVIGLTYTRSGEQLTKNVTLTNDGENNIDVSLTALQTDKHVVVGIDVSALTSLYILSNVAATIEWNDNAGAQGSLTLVADKPVVWYTGCGLANPLGAVDITDLYVTNGANSVGLVNIRLLQDATP